MNDAATTPTVSDLPQILELVARGALFVVSHSGGKDSQAMMALVRELVPQDQLLVVHAPLHGMEWEGTLEHVEATIGEAPLVLAEAVDKAGNTRSLLARVEERGMFPSPSQRWCTSDFKRGPIEREIRRYMKANGFTIAVNCMGLRGDESDGRECGLDRKAFKAARKAGQDAQAVTLAPNARLSKAGREVYDWLPIHALTVEEVFAVIAAAGQEAHWAYSKGMTRLSCCFCIMASAEDLRTSARHNPRLYAEVVALEKRVGHTMSMSRKGLEEVTGIKARVHLPVVAA